ncbi:ABC transporter ATP-binding protein [Candidatus Gottesmanbacteria bacterium]|nr:ABC transporter ATP-binding protein [Candidatus Gottesmanbacteria bacterium]
METVLEVKNLTKKFGGFTAVDDISFNIKEGEIVGLLGPNGAGKTTTIYMLLDILTPTNGGISYFGKDLVKNRSEIMHKINFSSTYVELPWRLTVNQNLEVLARLYGIKDIKGRVAKILDIFDIVDLKNKKTGTLSAGQKTKVFLAKAFLNFPKILLLDEPTASLDPEIAAKVRSILLEERKKFKTAMLFTSHNMTEVEEVCDRVIFINHGKIIAEDTPLGLASKTKLTSVRLTIVDGMKRTVAVCQKNKWQSKAEDRILNISLAEKSIASLFQLLAKEEVEYSEVTIQKPNLEDFFLSEVGKYAK